MRTYRKQPVKKPKTGSESELQMHLLDLLTRSNLLPRWALRPANPSSLGGRALLSRSRRHFRRGAHKKKNHRTNKMGGAATRLLFYDPGRDYTLRSASLTFRTDRACRNLSWAPCSRNDRQPAYYSPSIMATAARNRWWATER